MSNEKTIEDYLNKQGGYAHPMKIDTVNHPPHYTAHPSGVECIQITEHMNFCLGNAIKYIWRADLKHDAIEDLKKAVWYVNKEIERREALQVTTSTKTSSRES
jgi:hypothetical protein